MIMKKILIKQERFVNYLIVTCIITIFIYAKAISTIVTLITLISIIFDAINLPNFVSKILSLFIPI